MQARLAAETAPAPGIQARVADALRLAIVRGAYPPGAALSELALAEELRVSRTPVREALKQLETEGLVRVVPRVGTFVTEPSGRELSELLELQEVFEGLAARLLAARGPVPALDALAAAVTAAGAAAAAGDQDAFHTALEAFADALVDGAGSGKLALTYRWHMNQLAHHRLTADAGLEPAALARTAAGLARVQAAIATGDGDAAEFAMRDVVRGVRRDRALLAARPSEEET